jgi:hypothetical protein
VPPARLGGADLGRFEGGSGRMFLGIGSVDPQHAAVILRPRPVLGAVEEPDP